MQKNGFEYLDKDTNDFQIQMSICLIKNNL